MTPTWILALREELDDRVHTLPAELAAVARDASHVVGRPEALIYRTAPNTWSQRCASRASTACPSWRAAAARP